jgi:hypothetical protein
VAALVPVARRGQRAAPPALPSAAPDAVAEAQAPLRAGRRSAAPVRVSAGALASAEVTREAAQVPVLLRAVRGSAAPARASGPAARAAAQGAVLARASSAPWSAARGWDAKRAAADWVAPDGGRRSARTRSRARLLGSHRAAPGAASVVAWRAMAGASSAAAARRPQPWDCARRAAP